MSGSAACSSHSACSDPTLLANGLANAPSDPCLPWRLLLLLLRAGAGGLPALPALLPASDPGALSASLLTAWEDALRREGEAG